MGSDLMSRRLTIMGANSVLLEKGTFTGAGSQYASFDVTFEPDIIIIDGGLDFSESGWMGIGQVVFVKNLMGYHARHNSTTVTSAGTYGRPVQSGGKYGNYDQSGETNGKYEQGTFTVNGGATANMYRFISGQIYQWIAIKYT